MNATKLSDEVLIGPQPSSEELAELSKQGVAAVVNLRTPHEDDDPTSAREEGLQVQKLGMMYMNVPVEPAAISDHNVDDFLGKVSLLPKPIFVHCENGQRAAALALIERGVRQGWSGDETLAQAETLDLPCDHPEIQEFVKQQVESKQQ